MKRYRVLLIAEAANPEWTSVPLEGWSHSSALRELVDAHVVTQVRNRAAMERAGWTPGGDFTALDTEAIARPFWRLATLLRGGSTVGWTTAAAVGIPAYYQFERLLWKRFGARIRAREWDLVHRLTPLSPTYPSIIARRCRRAGVPFVVGPLNGGVPWPRGFQAVRRAEREWLSYVRDAYKLLPGYGQTRRWAAAVLIGSTDTWSQFSARHRHKCVYIPENAIDPARFPAPDEKPPAVSPLRAAFVGRLVPYKGADMLLEAAAPLVRAGKLEVDVIGDGPELPKLQHMRTELGIARGVRLHGWVDHGRVHHHLAAADIFAFPSIREFGGAVVLEAMAMGVVPIVVAYGGPAELVTDSTGYRVPLGTRTELVERFGAVLRTLAENPSGLREMGQRSRDRALRAFSWHAKACQTVEVYKWVLGDRAAKPDFGMPLPD